MMLAEEIGSTENASTSLRLVTIHEVKIDIHDDDHCEHGDDGDNED